MVASPQKEKKPCPFGASCYRKNPKHFNEFYHPMTETAVSPPPPTPAAPVGVVVSPKPARFVLPPSTTAATATPSPVTAKSPFTKTKLVLRGGVFVRVTDDDEPTTTTTAAAAAMPSPTVVSPVPTATVVVPAHTAASPKKRPREGDEAADPSTSLSDTIDADRWAEILIPPKPRTSSLALSAATHGGDDDSLKEVYEMPFPMKDMKTILEVAKALNPKHPLEAFPGWRLVGPFEVLLGGLSFPDDAAKWRYARFRYDPPEVQTFAISVEKSSGSTGGFTTDHNHHHHTHHTERGGQHLCFHRDDPSELPSMVVLGYERLNTFDIVSDRLAQALIDKMVGPPSHIHIVVDKLKAAFSHGVGGSAASVVKARQGKVVAKTIHQLGVVVPYNKKTELGYRPMMHTMAHLRSLVIAWNKGSITQKQLDELTEQFQWADIANDECDFGLNLEVGLDLFSLVIKRNDCLWHTWRILETAYGLLDRGLYRHVLQCHLPVLAGEMPPQLPRTETKMSSFT